MSRRLFRWSTLVFGWFGLTKGRAAVRLGFVRNSRFAFCRPSGQVGPAWGERAFGGWDIPVIVVAGVHLFVGRGCARRFTFWFPISGGRPMRQRQQGSLVIACSTGPVNVHDADSPALWAPSPRRFSRWVRRGSGCSQAMCSPNCLPVVPQGVGEFFSCFFFHLVHSDFVRVHRRYYYGHVQLCPVVVCLRREGLVHLHFLRRRCLFRFCQFRRLCQMGQGAWRQCCPNRRRQGRRVVPTLIRKYFAVRRRMVARPWRG